MKSRSRCDGQLACQQARGPPAIRCRSSLRLNLYLPPRPTPVGNVGEQFVDQRFQMRLHFGQLQIRAHHAHAAVDVVAHAAGRDHAPFVRIGRANAADAEAVAPVNIGHGQAGHLNAGQRGDVGHLLAGLVVADLLDQHVVGDRSGHRRACRACSFWESASGIGLQVQAVRGKGWKAWGFSDRRQGAFNVPKRAVSAADRSPPPRGSQWQCGSRR